MKIPKTVELNSFINNADGGTPTVETQKKSTKTGKTGLSLTEKQKNALVEMRDFANERNLDTFLFLSLEYAKENPINFADYTPFMSFITQGDSYPYRMPYTKGVIHQQFKDITAKAKKEWFPIAMKGIILMHVLHYVKNKYGFNISKYLDND